MWLHRLADAYDCPALKWQAWQAIKQVVKAYKSEPIEVLARPFLDEEEELPVQDTSPQGNQEGSSDEEENMGEEEEFSERDDDADGDNAELDDELRLSTVKPEERFSAQGRSATVAELSKRARAKKNVMNWARRLQKEWVKCEPELTEQTSQALALLKGELPYSFYRRRLCIFYEEHNPAKLNIVDELLQRWEGKEDELLKAVVDKYRTKMEKMEETRIYADVHLGGIGAEQREEREIAKEKNRIRFAQ